MNSDFEPPVRSLSILATVGGLVTAVVAIASLECLSSYLPKPALSHSQAIAASTLLTPEPESPAMIKAEKENEKKIDSKAAACRFDQSLTPNASVSFQMKTFKSLAMGQVRSYGLILPPGYNTHPELHYPVIFLLHGGHGDAGGWQACGAVTAVLDKLYKSGKLPPAIVITPDGNDKRGTSSLWDPQYFDGPNGQMATLIGSELVQEVKSRYRVLDDPGFWAMGGMSSGGWGAFNVGLRYLDRFHILFSQSGYFTDATGPANSPINLVQKLSVQERSALRVYLDAGTGDEKFLDSTDQFHQTLMHSGITHEFYVFPGGHGMGRESGWHYWHKHLADALSYVGTQWKSDSSSSSFLHTNSP